MSALDVLAVLERDRQWADDLLNLPWNDIGADKYMAIRAEIANAHAAVRELVAASRALMDGLDSTHWSSWQSTDKFTGHMDATRTALAAFPEPQS